MTVLDFLCILCSAGGVAATLLLILLIVAGCSLAGEGRPSTSVTILLWLVTVLMFGGFVSCSVEDRVCEISHRGDR